MKTTKLREANGFKSIEVFRAAIEHPPEKDIPGIKKRLRASEALENLPNGAGEIALEDSVYDTLRVAFDAMRWLVVKPEIVQIADDLQSAT
ncbi:hypothetical protein BH10PSE11_BH10PSE11_06000 [soil metagenome]